MKSSIPSSGPKSFTLVELLVVMAIISILAAILLPAISSAYRSAKGVACVNNLRQMGVGVIAYAVDNRRALPVNYPQVMPDTWIRPSYMVFKGFDQRPHLRPYIQDLSGIFSDPLCAQQDLDATTATEVNTAYYLYWGWRTYTDTVGQTQLGRGFDFEGKKFRVLACDKEFINTTNGLILTSHDDSEGILKLAVKYEVTIGTRFVTNAKWMTGSAIRGKIERSFLMDDGSVTSHRNLSQSNSGLIRIDAYHPHKDTPTVRPPTNFQTFLPASQ